MATGQQVNLGAASSSQTGNPYYVGDAWTLSMSIETGAAAASRITILGSNLDGFQSSLSAGGGYGSPLNGAPGWSVLTANAGAPGIFALDVGYRWINAIRHLSASGQTASNITVIFTKST